jgi:ABC-2 type transport system permease protein
VTGFLAAIRLQAALVRRSPDDLLALVTGPLLTVAFLAITQHAGRADLTGYAVLGPAILAVLGTAILTSGEVVAVDRGVGAFELVLAAPTPLPVVVLGRVILITVVSLVAVAESWLVALLGFGIGVPIAHPLLFGAALIAVALGTAGAATAMSAVFVLTRSARTFQNSLSYPLFLLGGVLVPVSLLPDWLRPVSRLFFLSWGTDLLRDSLAAAPAPNAGPRLAVVVGLAGLGYAAGFWLLARLVRRARSLGTVGLE